MAQTERPSFDTSGIDPKADPRDDFYRFANGAWLDATEIPSYKPHWGSFSTLDHENKIRLRTLLEELLRRDDLAPGTDEQKLRDFYRAGMDMPRRNFAGVSPLRGELDRIAAIKNAADLTTVFAEFLLVGIPSPFSGGVSSDPKTSDIVAFFLGQGGLGLPDREYYLADDKAEIRAKYLDYLERILRLGGEDDSTAASAQQTLTIEAALADISWEPARLRDIEAQCNYRSVEELQTLCPAVDWPLYFRTIGIEITRPVIVAQLDFLDKIDELLHSETIETWKIYLRAHLISAAAPLLSQDFSDAHFSFYDNILEGQPKPEPLWLECVGLTDILLGEALGKLYVLRHFPPTAKAKIEELIENLKSAFTDRIRNLGWMEATTKERAREKLRAITWKIGYPARPRDYTALEIGPGNHLENVRRAIVFETRRQLAKVGGPVDRSEWDMTSPTVNAYANPALVEMVFPAGILQPPFFDLSADDAVNYGAIGAIIAHELTHHFDDEGNKRDIHGNLNEWWAPEDRARFAARAERLKAQFNAYAVLGKNVNGELTIGENIADLGGLAIAYDAYRCSQAGKEPRTIDHFTPEQRFFFGWARAWRGKMRNEFLLQRIITDPHAPLVFRVNGPFSNLSDFYAAFDVREGNALYREPNERVTIW